MKIEDIEDKALREYLTFLRDESEKVKEVIHSMKDKEEEMQGHRREGLEDRLEAGEWTTTEEFNLDKLLEIIKEYYTPDESQVKVINNGDDS